LITTTNGSAGAELAAKPPTLRQEGLVRRFSSGQANEHAISIRYMNMTVVKAVVLATDRRSPEPWPDLGLSSRQLAPVANKPVLFHHLEALASAGIGEIAIVCDRRSSAGIREAVGDGSAWDLEVRYVEASPHEGILDSATVAGFIGSAPVVVQHGDVLLHEDLLELGHHAADNGLDALVMHAGRGSRTGSHPARGIDCYLFGAGVYSDLRRHAAPLRDALTRLRASGARIEERDVEACLPCLGGIDALLATNRRLLETMAADQHGERVFDSEIHGRLVLAPSAEIRDSVIRGPVSIGAGACITNAYIGPYTSIGPGVVIDCAEIEHSIVCDHAKLRHLPSRIESSIVGPGASVTHGFQVPRATRLSIGEGAQISLA
jgi:glucose-1-phosphate thymidylyltransferase